MPPPAQDRFAGSGRLRRLMLAAVVLLLLVAVVAWSGALAPYVLGPQVRGSEAVPVMAGGGEQEPVLRQITVTTVGDLLMHMPLNLAAAQADGTYDYVPMFAQVRQQLSRGDLTLANLETTLGGPERGYSGYPQFSTPDSLLEGIVVNGVDAVTTANNHAMDTGVDGLLRTLRAVRERGLTAIGTRAGSHEPSHALFTRNGIRMAVLAYTYGTNGIPVPEPWMVNLIDEERMAADIARAREDDPDLILVAMHWGNEYQRFESDEQRRLARFLHNEGVHAILGTHAHVVQPFELLAGEVEDGSWHETAVIYSTGNFISNQRQRYRDGGVMVHLTFRLQPSSAAGATVQLAEVAHTPVWVHTYSDETGESFRVLPAEPGSAELAPAMTDDDLRRKHQSYQDTVEILGPSPIFVRDDAS